VKGVLAGAALALALTACGSKTTTAPPATTPASTAATQGAGSTQGAGGGRDPCSLTTPAAITAAFGGTVAAGVVDTSMADHTCKFAVTGSNLGMDGDVVVFLSSGQTRNTFNIAKTSIPETVAVAGIGDDAFYNPHTTSIEFIKGATTVASVQGVFVAFGGPPVDPAKVKADTVALATAVAAGL
jgi:hypothetical protein